MRDIDNDVINATVLDENLVRRVGIAIGVILLTAFISMFIEIDGGVSFVGNITTEFQRKPVQHINGGKVISVLVTEGALVEVGDPIFEIKDEDLLSKVEANKKRYTYFLVKAERLKAEVEGRRLEQNLSNVRHLIEVDGPWLESTVRSELSFFQRRQQSKNTTVKSLADSILGLESELLVARSISTSRLSSALLAQNERQRMEGLHARGFISLSQLESVRQREDEQNALALEASANVLKLQRQIDESKKKIEELEIGFRRDAENELNTLVQEMAALKSQLAADLDRLDKQVVRAEHAGKIEELLFRSPGSLVRPNEVFCYIIPSNESLVIEGQIPVNQVEGVTEGTPARVNLVGNTTNEMIDGVVLKLSSDRVSPDNDNQKLGPTYAIAVAVNRENLPPGADLLFRPGLSVNVLITLKSRSLWAYLLEPFREMFRRALTEL